MTDNTTLDNTENSIEVGTQGDDILTSGEGDDLIVGLKGDDTIDGGSGDDVIISGKGDDTIIGGEGDDYINGGKGEDTVVYEGSYTDYDIDINNKDVTVTSLDGDVDTLKKVEILSFDDGDFYIDGTNNVAVAVADTAETGEEDSVSINLLENDFDFEGDDISLVSVDTSAIQGTVTIIDAEAGIWQ